MSVFTLTAPAVCAICGRTPATATVRPLDGLPKGVDACASCRDAVQRRVAGVVVRPDGSLHITDARRRDRKGR